MRKAAVRGRGDPVCLRTTRASWFFGASGPATPSTIRSTPRPPVSSRTSATQSPRSSIRWSAPNGRAKSNLAAPHRPKTVARDNKLELEPQAVSFAGYSMATMSYDPAEEGLEPHLIPAALAIRTFDTAINQGLPGAEHLAEAFLRDCGFDEAAARQMVLLMVSPAPLPDHETLN